MPVCPPLNFRAVAKGNAHVVCALLAHNANPLAACKPPDWTASTPLALALQKDPEKLAAPMVSSEALKDATSAGDATKSDADEQSYTSHLVHAIRAAFSKRSATAVQAATALMSRGASITRIQPASDGTSTGQTETAAEAAGEHAGRVSALVVALGLAKEDRYMGDEVLKVRGMQSML